MSDPVMAPRRSACYSLDRENRLCAVDEGWLRFACDNGAPELTLEAVLGRPITGFIADPTTSDLYLRLYQRVREGARPRLFFRCDSPAMRRDLMLELSLGPERNVRCETTVLREQPRPPLRLLDAGVARSRELLRMCSWCNKVLVHEAWREVEQAVLELDLFSRDEMPLLSHGICPECAAAHRYLEGVDWMPRLTAGPPGAS